MPTTPPSEEQPLSPPASTEPTARRITDSSEKLRHNLVSLSAAGLLFSFFLPWVTFLGAKLNGLDIQKNFSSYQLVWLMPLLALVVLVLNMARQNTNLIRRAAGFCPFIILVYAMDQWNTDIYKGFEIGAWLALLTGAALALIPSVSPGERKPTTLA